MLTREEIDYTMDGSPIRGLILFVIVLIVNFIMYCFGEACQNVNENELEIQVADGDKKAKKILKIVEKPRRFITSVQLTGIAFAIAVGFYQIRLYGSILDRALEKHFDNVNSTILTVAAYVIIVLGMLIALLAVGVIVPQNIGRRNPDKWTRRLIGIVNVMVTLLAPISITATGFAKLILKIFGIDYYDETENVTEEEIMSIVNEGHEQGVLEEQEAEMISNIIEMDDKEASEIMTHRTNIVAIDGNMTLAETVEFVVDEINSRFPVYDGDIDNIIGIVHIRDIFTCYKEGDMLNRPKKELVDIMREPKFIPETRNIDTLFEEMQKEKNHMVIVIDEYGQTAGIVTMEDILEEIVGNIFDEYDEEDTNIVHQNDNTYVIKGTTPLDDIENELKIEFDEEDYDTLNGYLISKLERIPSEEDIGDNIVINTENCRYEILAIEGKMISLVRATILEQQEDEKEDNQ